MEIGWETIIKSLNWTLILNTLAFFLLVWILKRVLFARAIKWLESRRKLEEERVSQAKALEAQALSLRKQAEEELRDANRRARAILAQAEAQAQEILRQAREEAKAEAQRILRDAEEAATRAQEEALQELRKAYAELVVLGAAQVLGREVRAEDHAKLLDELASRLGPALLS
ncbi:MAG: F0F1 ATP synthase subunit B [Candidatus Bipolaricaulota bacterium]|nr:F0F1 ATP synthase subunit B [Candidatus Bipolaricaulota bacterium]MDW8126260.1 F0F1 ATP synthase subunit B [Candidatus Bipolaricaulota bacterium]